MEPWAWIHETNTGAGDVTIIKGPLVMVPPEFPFTKELFDRLRGMRDPSIEGPWPEDENL